MKRPFVVVASLLSLVLIVSPLNAAGAKAGSKCGKVGITSINAGKKFTCIKSGKKLVWNKGFAIALPKPTATPEVVPSPSSSPAPSPTATTPAVPEIVVSSATAYRSATECKLVNKSSDSNVNQSHDKRAWTVIDSSKTVRGLIFSVDFSDLQSPTSDAPGFKTLMADFESYFQSQSNGKMKFTWTIAPNFTRMNKTISSYGVGSRAAGDVWKLNNDIQDLAFQTYKRESFDFIIGSAPTTTKREDIASSPAFGTNSPNNLPGTYLGGDYWSNGASSTIPTHEFGHFGFGLADLYDYDAAMLGASGFEKQFQYMGVFDLMNWAGGAGLELTSWNRWIARIISDEQILCLPDSATTTLLKPIEEVNDNVKGLVIPISNSSAIVIENRVAKGFDNRLPKSAEGILVYVVDTSIASGKGPMRIVRKAGSSDNLFRDSSLKNGESLTHLGYSIKVVGAAGENLYVEVKKAS